MHGDGEPYRGGFILSRRWLWAAAAATLVFPAAYLAGLEARAFLDWRAFSLVSLYTVILVGARYTPGRCIYRFAVLGEPRRHMPSELERARVFADYVGRRLLFGGLIFTLVEIAEVAAFKGLGMEAAGALSMTLTAALYALVLYLGAHRAALEAAPARS